MDQMELKVEKLDKQVYILTQEKKQMQSQNEVEAEKVRDELDLVKEQLKSKSMLEVQVAVYKEKAEGIAGMKEELDLKYQTCRENEEEIAILTQKTVSMATMEGDIEALK